MSFTSIILLKILYLSFTFLTPDLITFPPSLFFLTLWIEKDLEYHYYGYFCGITVELLTIFSILKFFLCLHWSYTLASMLSRTYLLLYVPLWLPISSLSLKGIMIILQDFVLSALYFSPYVCPFGYKFWINFSGQLHILGFQDIFIPGPMNIFSFSLPWLSQYIEPTFLIPLPCARDYTCHEKYLKK